MITIELEGEPRGKGRPRSRVAWTKGDKPFVAVYTDADTRKYEAALAWAAKAAMRSREPLDEPVSVSVEAYFGVPASWSNKKRDQALAGVIRPTGSPDVDNLLKVMDAFKGIVWRDDALVVEARVMKCYSERPLIRFGIAPIQPWAFACSTTEAAKPAVPL